MNFNKHLTFKGEHSFLSPSKYHWLNYTEEKLSAVYLNFLAAQRGTELHEFACKCIQLGINLPKNKKTLNSYVNDAIGFKMIPEQPLVYSANCFGTADAISFRNNFLRIHDLKTGSSPASEKQLEIYAAIFCLEYSVKPSSIGMELRLYQNDEVIVDEPPSDLIFEVMDKIITFDKQVEQMKLEA